LNIGRTFNYLSDFSIAHLLAQMEKKRGRAFALPL
jgi:hypothetical protein